MSDNLDILPPKKIKNKNGRIIVFIIIILVALALPILAYFLGLHGSFLPKVFFKEAGLITADTTEQPSSTTAASSTIAQITPLPSTSTTVNATVSSSPSATLSATATPSKTSDGKFYATVNVSTLNMRSGTSTSNTIVAIIPKGTKVEVITQYGNGWYKIGYNGQEGYCDGQYLNMQ